MNNPDLSFAIGLKPEDAIKYFASKGNQVTWSWRDMTGPEHAKDFTVAKAMNRDVLFTIREAVAKALAEGRTERMYAKDLMPLLQAKGWWGEQSLNNPDGEEELVQLGSPRRLETIFRTNLQTAYLAGRYQQLMKNVDYQPYWQYVAVIDGRTRKAHAALNGRVFRHDDPIWNHIYPPNGFRCRCRVTALSDFALKKQKLKVENSKGYIQLLDVGSDNPLASKVAIRLPGMDRSFIPDPGWDYNPGKSWALWDSNGRLPDYLDAGVAFGQKDGRGCIQLLPGQKSWLDYGRPDLRDVGNDARLPAPALLTAGANASEALSILQTALGVSDTHPMRVIDTPVDPVAIRNEWLPHLVEKRDQYRERYANYIVPTLEDPYEIWLTAYEDGYRKHYLGLFQDARDMLMVVRENRDGSLLWNAIRMQDKALNRRRAGSLIWEK